MPRPLRNRLIITTFLMSLCLGCLPNEDASLHEKGSSQADDSLSGHYFNSSKDHLIQSIEIFYASSGYRVNFYYAEGVKNSSGLLLDNEIIVNGDDNTEFHLYLNAEELRVYKVVQDGYQPEDIEWTFYKMR